MPVPGRKTRRGDVNVKIAEFTPPVVGWGGVGKHAWLAVLTAGTGDWRLHKGISIYPSYPVPFLTGCYVT